MRFRGLSYISRTAWVAVCAAAALSVGSTSAPAAGSVSCGDTITTDLTLTADLKKCAGNGLLVIGDAITLDLGGHTIRGSGTGVGITVTGTHIRIENGTVRGFQEGVHLSFIHGLDDSYTVVSGMTVTNNGIGILPWVPGGSIEYSKVSANAGDGIALRGGLLWTIKDSEISNNGGDGISLRTSGGATIERNSVTGNAGVGIHLVEFADQTAITDNLVARNHGVGIFVIDSTSQILRNTARNNGDTGILISEGADAIHRSHYLIADNTSNNNVGYGIIATPGMIDGGGNNARRNALTPACLNLVCA